MKILITGGANFIGSAVIRHIIRNTADSVVNLDKLTYAGNLESRAEVSVSERYVFEQVDICERAEVERVFSAHQPDAVMHLAAESHVDRSIDGPAAFIETNIVGTYTLLEVARQYWQALDEARKAAFRFHHISTDEVYGDLDGPEALITYVQDRPGHDQRYAIDADKIQRELGWSPEETFESGIRKTVEWYLNRLEWCGRVQDGSYQRERLGAIEIRTQNT